MWFTSWRCCVKKVMKTPKNPVRPLTVPQLLIYHFYPGLFILVFYICTSPYLINIGVPGLAGLLAAELVVLTPLAVGHLLRMWKQSSLDKFLEFIGPFEKLTTQQYIAWSIGGILACVLIYVPLYPLGLFLRTSVFSWLPPWYFDPGFGTDDLSLLSNLFLIGVFVDGLIAPIVEELFFRGYLLSRMTYLKGWAPVLNGTLFGLYHFWQPHNYPAVIGIGIVLSYVVWKKKNVVLSMIIHCSLNIGGALAGYFAASHGVLINR